MVEQKVNDELLKKILSEEDIEKELKRGGCKDLLNLMKCKNCLSMTMKDGKPYCIENKREANIDGNCSYWSENLGNKKQLEDIYLLIKEVLKEFIDTKEENYEIITLWILGTYYHNSFETYPYLFINAMKGSGKTRLLKLIKELSYQGDMLASLSEAVLFRTTGTLCIDEFENIGSKDKNALRELLNTAYKRGGKVKRMKKKKTQFGEEQVVEEFNTFRPIVMANIWGMEEVLGDRCISIILEKSNNKTITRKVESFTNHPKILKLKEMLDYANLSVVRCSVVTEKNIYIDWNTFITITTLDTLTTLTTLNNTKLHLFTKIYETNIDGRNLELAFPLFMIAEEVGILESIINIFKQIVEDKKTEDIMEGRDVMLFDFIAKQSSNEWYKLKELVSLFRTSINYDEEEDHWLNAKWCGKALKRLNLLIQKRRVGEGIEVVLNIEKAKDKLRIFK